jgi:hypothetical protein
MRRRNIMLASALALIGALIGSAASAEFDDPIGQADLISTIGVARVADEAGDQRLLSWLKAPARRDLALVAVRAAPFAHAPELLVPELARLLCGRDPVLAPESAYALAQIVERITPSAVELREAALADFATARASLACAREQEPAVRPDLVKHAMLLEAALAQLAP